MRSYEIKIDIGRLLHYSDVLRPQIDNETLLMLINSFSSYIRRVYLTMIHDAIYSRRYKGEWEPIGEEGYIEFLDTTPTTHILELIYDALEVRKLKNHIVVRIDPGYKYPGSKLTLLKVINAIDNGTSKFNARPIFNSIVRNIQNNLPRLWKMYLKKRGVA